MKAVTAYLAAYNALQAVGWGASLVLTLLPLLQGQSIAAAFQAGAPPAKWMQLLAFAEILHAAAGLVKSNPVQNFWQWLGRSNALLLFAARIPELQPNVCSVLMLLVWSLGEVIRYPWYAATLLGACPTWLTFARYTAFIGLYPLGVVAEMVLLHLGVPYVRARSIASVHLPNAWNFAWDHALFVQVMLFLYPYLWWQNYSSLLRQRRKKVGPQSATAAAGAGGHTKAQ